ncbi:MAG TPA: hypothetical protein DCP38_17555 [Acidobacteria bacterium]|jgi:hypothetical protein|nr:hypothetical protein [Acidobacteriota bacterium]MDP6373471.1 DUF1353 domain-containing protein [Vicinamibacterales bacterium]MQG57490.1 DUF1353 domain-containing protein [SAR202 cluster bacterium]HAK57262.1 hypothetical protein [Acidobacteriota bacterium]|tara:strand:- start:3758 stop:4177 length:420 start_codon:yes stop_codon:yes gene_type:complete
MTDEICHHGICYQRLTSGQYRYKLTKDYHHETDIVGRDGDILPYLSIDNGGKLSIFHRYAWDGPSGPSFDTKNFMRGSLVHDALYQLMRERILDHKKDRKRADQLLREICRKDGMSWFRAWYVYRLLRIFGGRSARPRD